MKVATWNVNGIRARHEQLRELLETEQPDVVCLQEIKATPAQIPEPMLTAEGYWSYWHGGGGYSGVGLLVRRTLAAAQPVFAHPDFDFEHRIVIVTIGGLTIASVYVPNGGKDFDAKLRFLEGLNTWVAESAAAGGMLLVCGDINIAREERDIHPKERKPNQMGSRPEERALLNRLMASGLIDVGRAMDPDNDNLFTWWAPWRNLRQRNIGWRIDYQLASAPLAATAAGCASMREFGTSDHAPVVATFQFDPAPPVT
jgi:exodeoxyribonuclease-3